MSNENRNGLFQVREGKRFVFDPEKNDYVPVHDATQERKEYTEKYPPSGEAQKAFYQHRIKQVEASTLRTERKESILQDMRRSVEEVDSASAELPPIPGGVGYGVYFNEDSLKFVNSSVLSYRIVTVPELGAELNEWLYLTSTNRSPKGTEAFVSYHQQENPTFTVFDWSKEGSARWSLRMPFSELGPYLKKHIADGQEFDTIYVMNSTRRLDGTRWTNDVLLQNEQTGELDLVYSHEYNLAENEEEDGLDWGPIVETFPPFPNETTPIGFFTARLQQDDGEPRLLGADDTHLRTEDPGFSVTHFMPNHSFIVH